MRLSKYFLPILKENPKDAEIVSHRLMARAGMIKQQSAGIYSWLPLGKRVLDKVCNIVREEQNRAGAIEILMPTIQPADLWRESGRYDDYGQEMLRINDRNDREMLLRTDQRGNGHRHLPVLRQVLQGPAAQPLSHPVEVP
jgi:prolyl-tRNA synthetase